MATRSSLGEHLAAAQYVLVLIGAGVSSPSGIPTYRGESSCGNDNALITPLTFSYYPDQVWEYFTRKRRTAIGALPNPAHYAIARLARDKEHVFAITQNIDGLSQRAGHSTSKLAEIHGSLFEVQCENEACRHVSPAGASMEDQEYRALRNVACPECAIGTLRPGVTWFGERLRQEHLDRIDGWLKTVPRLDLMLVVGTSCRVFPAAEYIHTARRKGAFVAHFNLARDDTWMEFGDWYVPGDVATTLPGIVSECFS